MELTKDKIKAITEHWNSLKSQIDEGTLDLRNYNDYTESQRYMFWAITNDDVDYIVTTNKKDNITVLDNTVALHTDDGFALVTIEELNEKLRG